MEDIFVAHSKLEPLSALDSLNKKLSFIHNDIKNEFPFIDRIAVALHDEQMDTLTTFIQSTPKNPLSCYTARMDEAPSLNQIKTSKKTRVVNDLSLFKDGKHYHTKAIAEQGYQSSCAVPMLNHTSFVGIIFFNAFMPRVFPSEVVSRLTLHVKLINCLITHQLMTTRMLLGAFRGALDLVSYKDPETGNHLERMARYAKLIAQDLSNRGIVEMDDEIIEQIYLFAPLHDIGKIGIPDRILLKPGKLNAEEWQIMQTHSQKGKDIVNAIAGHMGQASFRHMNLLRNISGSHHETIDGEGYPEHLAKDEIPIETQIITVADIFDALTSKRSYKPAWSNSDAFKELNTLAGKKLNTDCVNALITNERSVIKIQNRFRDDD